MNESGARPIPIGNVFGDPDIVEKAKAAVAGMEFCRGQGIKCPWLENGECTVNPCPAARGEIT